MKRIIKTEDERDAYSKWRRILCSYQRAGAVKKVKKRTHRRERREAKQYIQEQLED